MGTLTDEQKKCVRADAVVYFVAYDACELKWLRARAVHRKSVKVWLVLNRWFWILLSGYIALQVSMPPACLCCERLPILKQRLADHRYQSLATILV
eukprot:SAG31_NODE_3683_length_3989_cov_3.622108_4_plen_96_part_00